MKKNIIDFAFRYPRYCKYWTKKADKSIDTFVKDKLTHNQYLLLRAKLFWYRYLYRISFDEFFLFNVVDLKPSGIRKFAGEDDHLMYADSMNKKENKAIFDDKWLAYQRFKEFYGREIVLFTVDGKDDENKRKESFESFTKKHPEFIVKPIKSTLGKGVKKIKVKDYASINDLYDNLISEYIKGFVLEELIIQDDEFARLHKESVNSLRVTTVRFDDRIEFVHPFLRIGKGNSVVDNAGAGGVMGLIDVETGIVYASADEYGNRFVVHPDTKEQVVGFKVPKWEEAKEFVRKLTQVIPDNRYSGWDIALTKNGWVMIEGNTRAQFVWQMVSKQGSKEEFEGYIKELGIKELVCFNKRYN